NGTDALYLSLKALDIGIGDEVLLSPYSFIATCASIHNAGAKPVFVDIKNDYNIDENKIENAITKKTKALLIPHIYGLPVDMDFIEKICKKYNLLLIEDAAEMIGQTCGLSKCGSFGDLSTFSFYANKHITTGEGGMIVTNDTKIAQSCRSLRNICFNQERRFLHYRLGWNYRFTN
ncbi:MAG: aminotransferase class I/II-fold pyridoxal phosphate-dependent enzyme, partial [Acidobacteriota bacterium]|nr:aminotransferase class I/II-fold pyridoxal phosphate-dependent enzyme [Acidobacteriota bacterium]